MKTTNSFQKQTSNLMKFPWLQRWNFIERAKLERQLWDAFERGESIEALVDQCQDEFTKEVWTSTAASIRKIESVMRDQQQP
jgi:hypothetical protein